MKQVQRAELKYDIDKVIERTNDHWGMISDIVDNFKFVYKLEKDYENADFVNPHEFEDTCGGFLMSFDFNNELVLSHFKADVETMAIKIGSSLSILYGIYCLIRFLVGIKYRNWLGSYLLQKKIKQEENLAVTPTLDSSNSHKRKHSCLSEWVISNIVCWFIVLPQNKEQEIEMGKQISTL